MAVSIRPRNRRNDFGGTMGGPVYIPKIYNGHNKTFWFFNYEEFLETTFVFLQRYGPYGQLSPGQFLPDLTEWDLQRLRAIRDSDHGVGYSDGSN